MDKILVLLGAIALIGLILWWFFGKRDSDARAARRQGDTQIVEVTVDGGYSPNIISLDKGVPAELVFTRKDPSGCLEQVVFPDFGVSEFLPVNQPRTIKFTPEQAGEYKYACGMNMFFGKVVVK